MIKRTGMHHGAPLDVHGPIRRRMAKREDFAVEPMPQLVPLYPDDDADNAVEPLQALAWD